MGLATSVARPIFFALITWPAVSDGIDADAVDDADVTRRHLIVKTVKRHFRIGFPLEHLHIADLHS